MLFGFSLLIQFTIPAWGLLVVTLPLMLAMQEALQLSCRQILVLGRQCGGQAALAPPAGCGWGNGAGVLWVLLRHSIHDLNSVHTILREREKARPQLCLKTRVCNANSSFWFLNCIWTKNLDWVGLLLPRAVIEPKTCWSVGTSWARRLCLHQTSLCAWTTCRLWTEKRNKSCKSLEQTRMMLTSKL